MLRILRLLNDIKILFNSLDNLYALPYAIIRYDFSANNGYKSVGVNSTYNNNILDTGNALMDNQNCMTVQMV